MREINPEKPSYFSENKAALDAVAEAVDSTMASGEGRQAIGWIGESEANFMAHPDIPEILTEAMEKNLRKEADQVALQAADVLRPRRPWNRLTLPDPIGYESADVQYNIKDLNQKVYYELCKTTLFGTEAADSIVGYRVQIMGGTAGQFWNLTYINGECVRATAYEAERDSDRATPLQFESKEKPTAEELEALAAILQDIE